MPLKTFSVEAFKAMVDAAPLETESSYELKSKLDIGLVPYMMDGNCVPAAIAVLHWTSKEGGKNHTTAVGLIKGVDGEEKVFLSCGDGFLSGKVARFDAVKRTNDTFADVLARKVCLAFYGMHPNNNSCGFWASLERDSRLCGCIHMRLALNIIKKRAFTDKVILGLRDVLNNPSSATRQSSDDSTSDVTSGPVKDDLESAFDRYAGPSVEDKTPILVMGEQGASKTYTARVYGRREFKNFIEVGCHFGMEAMDFIGGQLPAPGGQLLWMDGPIAQAFRKAAAGEKVFLLVDEIYRAPRRERSVFLTALSPHNGHYRLMTGRPINIRDGVADQEILEAPIKNITIVATTNVGPEFEIEEDDPAQKERWVHVYRFTDEKMLRNILSSVAATRKYSGKTVDRLLKFFVAMVKCKADGMAAMSPTVRVLTRAMNASRRETEIPTILKEFAPMWVTLDHNGRPTEEQIKAVNKAVDLSWL